MTMLARLGLAAALVLFGASASVAYWTAEGGGLGRGSAAGSVDPVAITAASASQSLVPTGQPSGDVAATIANPNAFGVRVRLIALDPTRGRAGFSPNEAGCQLSFTTQDNGGSGWAVPAQSSVDVVLRGAVTMGTGAASTCQGQVFTVYLAAS